MGMTNGYPQNASELVDAYHKKNTILIIFDLQYI